MPVNRFFNFLVEETTTTFLPNPSHPPVCDVHVTLKHRFWRLLRSASSVDSEDPLPSIRIPTSSLASSLVCNLHILKAVSGFNLERRLRDFLSRNVTRASVELSGGGHVGFRLVACVEILTVYEPDEWSENRLMKRLASRVVIDKLIRQKSVINDQDRVGPCAVCLEEFSSGGANLTVTLPCSHVFHHSCICRWLEEQNKCPMCRRGIESDDFDCDIVQDLVVSCGCDDHQR
ncbi:hypothetical protein Q3G72_029612 [Acer saccharum]|nr:hypothetical protein Q3G72_029612 [Acer saccharum]